MFYLNPCLDQDDQAWLVIHTTRDRRDVVAILAIELFDRHDSGCRRCLVDPPNWTYYFGLGLGHRLSLGASVWRFGQWAFRRVDSMPSVLRERIDARELVSRYGWAPDSISGT